MRRVSAAAGIIGPLLFGIVVVFLSIAKSEFMRSIGWDPLLRPTFDWPSGLSLGTLGWLMTATFIASGVLMSVFALGLRRELRNRSGQIGSGLLTAAGVALTGLAFTTDPTIRTTPATWHGEMHDLSFVLLGLTLISALIALGFDLKQDRHWKALSPYSWATAALAIPTFAFKGIVFYVFLLGVLLWSEATAIRLWQ
jgi:uncharacterized protein DUF998